jgi:hypothetical protein
LTLSVDSIDLPANLSFEDIERMNENEAKFFRRKQLGLSIIQKQRQLPKLKTSFTLTNNDH